MTPLLDLRVQNQGLAAELEAAFARVLRSGRYVLGEEVEHFEAGFAAYCGTEHAVAVSSGTAAIQLALLAAGIGPGDEVITSTMTFVATVAAIEQTGARTVLVDIDPDFRTLDPRAVDRAVTGRTRAIIPVHLHGGTADMDAIRGIADAYGLTVIEDAAQAHGAEFRGRRAGGLGDLGCFSFYPGKNLGACGEGGAVVTDDGDRAATLRMLRDWGQREKYQHVLKGFNYRMDAIQGAILAVKLARLEAWTDQRRERAARYLELLEGKGLGLPREAADCRHVYHVFALEVADRDRMRDRLARAGVATGIHYPLPVHLQPAYRDLGYRRGDFPVAERFAEATLSLPLYPELELSRLVQIADALLAVEAASYA